MIDPKRVILDTSVYGQMITEPAIVERVLSHVPVKLVFYGTPAIRKELRKVAQEARLAAGSKRILLLSLYDSLTREHVIHITDLVQLLAEKYWQVYKSHGGAVSQKKLKTDFQIVGCASLPGMDVLVSHDRHSLLSRAALRAYAKVNQTYQLRTPLFLTYERFKQTLEDYL